MPKNFQEIHSGDYKPLFDFNNMNEKNMLYLSLIGSFIGIIGLIIVSYFEEATAIQEINEDYIDKKIIIIAEIIEINKKEEVYLLNLKDKTGEIKGIIFTDEDMPLEKNKEFKISGTITEYQGSLEIIIGKLEKV